MQQFNQHTRRQRLFIACAITLLGATAIVPWRVVAQEEKSDGKTAAPAAKAPAKADERAKPSEPPQRSSLGRSDRETRGVSRGGWWGGRGDAAADTEERTKLEKLLVGVWHGGRNDGD